MIDNRMLIPADMDLVREYARSGSEEAFRVLVERHLNLVYSAAYRKLSNPHEAEEVCQAVFIILASKAAKLPQRTVLAGWLYETARLTAANCLRSQIRRSQREQEAQMQSTAEQSELDAWGQVAPVLDEAMAHLNEKDRNAVVLRFFQTKSFQDVGASLGLSEDAAKMRVNRAVEKLRKFFLRRGVTVSATALSAAVAAHAVQSAATGLAASVSAVALSHSVTHTSTFILIKTTLKVMAWTKAKTVMAIGAAVLLAATTTTVTLHQIIERHSYPWQVRNLSSDLLDRVAPQVRIVATKFPNSGGSWVSTSDKFVGLGHSVESILVMAYGEASSARVVSSAKLPQGHYDLIANLPRNSREALQQELKRKFGLSASHQPLETNILRLTVKTSGAVGLRASESQTGSASSGSGRFSCVNQPLSCLASTLENCLHIPVLDHTGLTGTFDIDLTWDEKNPQNQTLDSINQALEEELGLKLTPATQTIEMLVVQRSR
jgi:uncharacterized protein (TIGR03435 family)